MKMKRDMVLVKQSEPLKQIGNLTSVVTVQEFKGDVINIGPKVEDIQVGDTVIFTEFGFTRHTIEGVEYLAMKEEEIIIEL